MTTTSLDAWIATARPNDSFCYYAGAFLPQPGDDAAWLARKLYDEGRVELVQRKIGPNKFEYLAVKRREVVKRAPYFGKRPVLAA